MRAAASVLHRLVGRRAGGGLLSGLRHLGARRQVHLVLASDSRARDRRRHLSLRPLLQPLQEGGHVVVVIDGELHVLTHDADGNVLKRAATQ